MKFDEIMAIVSDQNRTDYQKSADIDAAFQRLSKPSALSIQPMKARKARATKAARPIQVVPTHDAESVRQVDDEAA